MKNIKNFAKVAEPVSEAKKIKLLTEATQIARFSKPTAYLEFSSSIIRFCFVSERKDYFEEKLAKCSAEAQNYIKSLAQGQETDSVVQEKKPVEAKTPEISASTEPKQPAPTPSAASSAGDRIALRKANSKNDILRKQLEELKTEYESISKSSPTTHSVENENLTKLRRELDEAKKVNASLDEELKQLQNPTQEKELLQKEIAELKDQISEAEGKLNKPVDIAQLQQSENPEIKEIIEKIKAAEERIKPEYEITLRTKLDKLKEVAKKLKSDVIKIKEKAGEAKEEPENEEVAKIEGEIAEIINRNNQLNKDIMTILSRTEAIEQARSSRSFLEHLRTSDAFLSTH
jgi:DNA repair exonuclease SbcCD ATPase subunit